jgi:ribonuclease Z
MSKNYNLSKSLTAYGGSVSAEQTAFIIPELELQLDGGIDFKRFVRDFFITHSHRDHTKALADIVIIQSDNRETINIHVPEEIFAACDLWLKTSLDFSKSNVRAEGYSYYNIIPVKTGSTFIMTTFNKKILEVEVFKCFHTVPCIGYGFSEKRKHLKDEYKELSGSEIGALRKSGVEITNDVFVPLLVFLGDTTHKVFDNPEITKFPIIMVECTYYEVSDIKLAKSNSHMHWKFLEPIIKSNPKNKFVIMHPSSKIKMSTIKKKYVADNLLFI